MPTRRRNSRVPEKPHWQEVSGGWGTACDRVRNQSSGRIPSDQAIPSRRDRDEPGGAQARPTRRNRVLDDRWEEIVRTTINRYYLTRNRPSFSQLVRDVQTNCISGGLRPPHRRTIKARLEDIDLQKRAKRRGETKVTKNTRAVPGGVSRLPAIADRAGRSYESGYLCR